ncbi:MAG: sugar ABC transporter substrate-binding protein [Mesorhizobium sp.]|uniref:substrate-binding domain-containing protein n=1 Tax=Mesorhizobium sp. TaxID=1871066 RepID=UPI000FE50B35|nr:substrate-binding domain-containing protein [Mesorhizobium sp.]RWO94297.1 MAG: sugar ABC transporter substrate-binding protein [Mesorhizobium sp.]
MASAIAVALSSTTVLAQSASEKTFYWISNGSPTDPVWTYSLQGAEQFGKDTGTTINTTFHSNDVPSQQEAIRAAIAVGADGICTSSPGPGTLVEVVKEAHAAKIPIINFDTKDAAPAWKSYIGVDYKVVGRAWAQYLVDRKLVKKGDFVWMPLEVPGAGYGEQAAEGADEVFKPLGITWQIQDASYDQAEVINRMTDYLTANRDKINAMIGLGDMVTGSVKRVWDQAGVKPGEIPVVGWGNSLDTTQEMIQGYVNAAMWQDPQATSYMCLSALMAETSGIPIGFDIVTGALYEADKAPFYAKTMGGK